MDDREISKELINFLIKLKRFGRANVSRYDDPNLTEQQFRTLINLKELKKTTLKHLSNNIHVSSSSLCIMLNKMVEEDIVIREADSKDRRNTFYSLTSKGLDFLENEIEKKLERVGEKISNLSLEEKEKLVEYINGISDIIEKIK